MKNLQNGVSRRSFLRSAAGAAALAVIPGRLLFGCASSSGDDPDAPATEGRTLHFDLSHGDPDAVYTLRVGPRAVELTRHTEETRLLHREKNGFLTQIPDEKLTHHTTVELPGAHPISFSVTHENAEGLHRSVALTGVLVPTIAVKAAALVREGRLGLGEAKRRRYLRAAKEDGAVTQYEDTDVMDFVDPTDAATFCAFHHPELMTLDGTTAALVIAHIQSVPALDDLAGAIAALGPATGPADAYQGWTWGKWSLDLDGNKMPRLDVNGDVIKDASGNVQYEFDYIMDPSVHDALGPVVHDALLRVRNDPALDGTKYIVTSGIHAETPQGKADGGAYTFTFDRNNEWRYGQRVTLQSVDAARNVSVTVDNSYFRHLSVFGMYSDVDANPLTLAQAGVSKGALDTTWCKYLGMLAPPPRIMGAPVVGSTVVSETYDVAMPESAGRLSIVTGATAWNDGDYGRPELDGVIDAALGMTMVFEFGFPTLMLAAGVGGVMAEKVVTKVALAIGPTVLKAVALIITSKELDVSSNSLSGASLTFVNIVLKKMVGGAASCFYILATEAEAESTAEHSIPFVGWIMFAVDVAVSLAEMVTTIVDIGLSRRAVASEMTVTHDVAVTLNPDPDDYEFPATATHFEVVAMLSRSVTRTSGPIPIGNSNVAKLTHTFHGIPTGGTIQLHVVFTSNTSWVAGQATSLRMENVSHGAAGLAVAMTIEENLVPLDATTTYAHKMRLTMQPDGTHAWTVTSDAPTETAADLACGTAAAGLCADGSITFAQKNGQVGYSWQALSPGLLACSGASGTQMFVAQNMNVDGQIGNGAPDAARHVVPCGFLKPAHLAYSLMGDPDGDHFLIAPDAAGVYHARKITLGAGGTLDVSGQPSWGQFTSERITAAAVHPAGYLAVLNGDYSKVEVLRLSGPAASDAAAPVADLLAGKGTQKGFIIGGSAIAATQNGRTMLVLEDVNRRIQALDDYANPVETYFAPGGGAQSCFAPLKDEGGQTVTYLDMAVETTGYIYILSYTGGGTAVDDYRLDIYTPKGDWQSRTMGLNAARMTVDKWRNVFALNFEHLAGPGGLTEPSVSQWIPSTPPG